MASRLGSATSEFLLERGRLGQPELSKSSRVERPPAQVNESPGEEAEQDLDQATAAHPEVLSSEDLG